ncbi:MAG: hypothetical protein H8Z69_05205 [Nanohaloarchaea archaeon]|nr:hypothetical protein [Candidatus Nanohaloarchaea archaeon]
MSANIRAYEDHFEYLPEKEKKAVKQLLDAEEEDKVPMMIVKQVDRNKMYEEEENHTISRMRRKP